MSTVEFRVDDWIQAEDPDPRRACTSAELVIIVDDVAVTRLLDMGSRTVTDRARVPLYPLAEWLAANWWRLHAEAPYEGGGYPPLDWRLSHDLSAIGGGFVWPRLRFASDGQTIQATARAARNAPWEPVRHLNDLQPARAVTVQNFDRAVEELINLVLRRMNDLGVPAEPLASIWKDVVAERSDTEVVEWRVWEARLGYDPEQAPERLMKQVASLFGTAGKSATAEVAPLLNSPQPATIAQLEALARAPGVEADFPKHDIQMDFPSEIAPWDAGRRVAHLLRDSIGRSSGPISDQMLNDVLGAKAALENTPAGDIPIALGVRAVNGTRATLHFRKRSRTGMRFQAARFLAEALRAPLDDSWLPLTDRGTARQKFQRAFAAEFLAPINEIREAQDWRRSSDGFEELADHYGVSPLTIRSHLANHGLLTPDEVVV
jgi:hypothetical protein